MGTQTEVRFGPPEVPRTTWLRSGQAAVAHAFRARELGAGGPPRALHRAQGRRATCPPPQPTEATRLRVPSHRHPGARGARHHGPRGEARKAARPSHNAFLPVEGSTVGRARGPRAVPSATARSRDAAVRREGEVPSDWQWVGLQGGRGLNSKGSPPAPNSFAHPVLPVEKDVLSSVVSIHLSSQCQDPMVSAELRAQP